MTKYTTRACLGIGVGVAAAMMAPAFAHSPPLAMLKDLDSGSWTVRFRDNGETRKICLRTGRELIQLRHRASGCGRYVVEDGANIVTVQYSCSGDGYGRTSVRRETSSLVQVESQGISNGKPFQFTAEARRTGSCR